MRKRVFAGRVNGMRIGFYDSGVGGISVLYEAMRKLPAPDYLYLADEAHVPYGTRSTEEIRAFATEAVSCLEQMGADCVVVACNTASSAAIHELRETFSFPVVGMEPAVKPAVEQAKQEDGARVMVLATPFTIRGKALHELIARLDAERIVDLMPMPRLVEFAEQGVFDGADVEEYLRETLGDAPGRQDGRVVLGCTHFNYFLPALSRVFPEGTVFSDGREGTVRQLAHVMNCRLCEDVPKAEVQEAWGRVVWLTSGIRATDPEETGRYLRYLERMEALYGTGR